MVKRTLLLSVACLLACASLASAASAQLFFSGAVGGAKVRPHTLALTGDGTLEVTGMQWGLWRRSGATGSGTAEYHGCTPSCAAGKSHSALVGVALSDPVVCGGRTFFNRVTLRLPGGRELDPSFLRGTNWAPCASH